MGLAFGRGGEVLGEISQVEYEDGVKEVAGEAAYYLATMRGEGEDGKDLVTVTVRVEYPATLKSERRKGVSLHTKLP